MGGWVCLFSGGKDSSWALYRALEEGLPVQRLVTVIPPGDSYLYHTPLIELTSLAAERIGIPHTIKRPENFDLYAEDEDVSERGDRELKALESTLDHVENELGFISGIVVGAIESEYQNSRFSRLCERYDADLFAPEWQTEDHRMLLETMIDAGFKMSIVRVSAGGLDKTWLGRTLDKNALTDLESVHNKYGIHLLGEGGEYETFVFDGPHMNNSITTELEATYDGVRGHLEVPTTEPNS